MLYLYLPMTQGAQVIYVKALRPLLTKYSPHIDNFGGNLGNVTNNFAGSLKNSAKKAFDDGVDQHGDQIKQYAADQAAHYVEEEFKKVL